MDKQEEIFLKLRKIIAVRVNKKEADISIDSTFISDLGADSLEFYDIVMDVEKSFNISIPDNKVTNLYSIRDAVQVIATLVH